MIELIPSPLQLVEVAHGEVDHRFLVPLLVVEAVLFTQDEHVLVRIRAPQIRAVDRTS